MSHFSRLLVALLAVVAASLGTTWFVLHRAVGEAESLERESRRDGVARRISAMLEREPDLVTPVSRWAGRAEARLAGRPADAEDDGAVRAAARAEDLDGWLVVQLGTGTRFGGGDARPAGLPPGGVAEADSWWDRHGDRLLRCAASVRGIEGPGARRGLALIGCRVIDPTELADRLLDRFGSELAAVEIVPAPPGRAIVAAGEDEIVVPVRSRRGVLAWVRAVPAAAAGSEGIAARLRSALTGGLVAGAIVAALLAGLLAAGQVAPLRRLARAIDGITRRGLSPEPMPVSGGETGRVARAIDRMLAALHQEQLRRIDAERRAAWRDVARKLAHEVRNPLTPIRLAVDNLRRAAGRSPEAVAGAVDEETAAIRAEVDRLERLVREFAEYARLPSPTLRPVDPGPLVRQAVTGQAAGCERVALDLRIPEDLPQLEADPDLLGAAVSNVARNAVEALREDGGHLTVEVLGAAGRVVIRLADDGPGIPPDLAARIFEPYVSGSGSSGLGLAITRQIVEQQGGTIRAEPGAGGGTVFTIELPVHDGADPAKES